MKTLSIRQIQTELGQLDSVHPETALKIPKLKCWTPIRTNSNTHKAEALNKCQSNIIFSRFSFFEEKRKPRILCVRPLRRKLI